METFPNFSTLRIALLFSIAIPSSPLPNPSRPPVYGKCYLAWTRNCIYRRFNLCYWAGSRWGRPNCTYSNPREPKKWRMHFFFSHPSDSSLNAVVEFSHGQARTPPSVKFSFEKGQIWIPRTITVRFFVPMIPTPPHLQKENLSRIFKWRERACFNLKIESFFSCVERVLFKRGTTAMNQSISNVCFDLSDYKQNVSAHSLRPTSVLWCPLAYIIAKIYLLSATWN